MNNQRVSNRNIDRSQCEYGDPRDVERSAAGHHNDDSRLLELVRSSTMGYGTADVSASGVDRSQLRHNLRLTPTQRVEQMVAFVRFVLPLQGALRRQRD
jgi:hypothetical protein